MPPGRTHREEEHMLKYTLDTEHGILFVQPMDSLQEDDFAELAKAADP